MKKRSLLGLMLAGSMLLGLVAGCGNIEEASASADTPAQSAAAEPETPAPDPPTAPETSEVSELEELSAEESEASGSIPVSLPIVDEPTAYSIWYSEPFGEYVDNPAEDLTIFRLLAEKTNIHLEFVLNSVESASEQFQLLYASDSLPDIITDAMSYYTGSIDDAVFEDEFLYDYSGDLDTKLTNFDALLEQYVEARKTITSATSGAMVSFPEMYKDVGDEDGYMIRKDYLDLVGMEIPETYDEMHDVLSAIHQENGSGLDLAATGCDGLLGAGFGINVNLDDSDLGSWYVEDGQVKMGLLQDEFLDYITMVTQWYSEGLVFADFMNSDNGDLSNLFSGQVSITKKVPEIINVAAMVVGAEMAPLTIPVKNKGDTINVCGAVSSCLMDPYTWSINANVEEVNPLLALIDYMYSPEATDMMNYGEEGVSFNYDEDGNPVFTDLVLNNPDGYDYAHAAYFYATSNRTWLPFLSDYARCFNSYSGAALEAVNIYSSDCTHEKDYPPGAIMDTDQKAQYNTVAADIATFISENVLQFIIGQKDLSEWGTFIDTLYDMGIETAIEAKQGAYDDYLGS